MPYGLFRQRIRTDWGRPMSRVISAPHGDYAIGRGSWQGGWEGQPIYTESQRARLLDDVTEACQRIGGIQGLVLVGSGAYGFRDAYSDLDVYHHVVLEWS